jgi:hypothetical protein
MGMWQRPLHPIGGLGVLDELASLERATAWINSPALAAANLSGKVVLVQFCTFTCINWLRTLPYMRAWADRYKSSGLVVIGVHTPEFPFEKNLDNVRRAIAEIKIDYPIAVDNDFTIWRAFRNQYWPALYLFDAMGRVRHHHFGEGGYAQTEMMIQRSLADAGAHDIAHQLSAIEGGGIEAAADWPNLKSPENYVGYERTENFGSPGGIAVGQRRVYALPRVLPLNHWALQGDWIIDEDSATLNQPNGRIADCFHARDLNLVMGLPIGTPPVRYRVLIDGQPPAAAHGVDVNEEGNGLATEQRLYQLIRQPGPIVDRVCQIEFMSSGVQAFAFTFG